MITKDSCTYKTRNLRQEQTLRDHGGALGTPMRSDVTRMRPCTTSTLSSGVLARDRRVAVGDGGDLDARQALAAERALDLGREGLRRRVVERGRPTIEAAPPVDAAADADDVTEAEDEALLAGADAELLLDELEQAVTASSTCERSHCE
jgi:hypothetical protein